jgi:hypothetical protein
MIATSVFLWMDDFHLGSSYGWMIATLATKQKLLEKTFVQMSWHFNRLQIMKQMMSYRTLPT